VATTVAVAFVAGGERIPAYRLLLPAWPVLALSGEAWLRQLRIAPQLSSRLLLLGALLAGGLGLWLLIFPGSLQSAGEAMLQQGRVLGDLQAHGARWRSELRGLGGMALALAVILFVVGRSHASLRDVEEVEGGRRSGGVPGPGRLVRESLRSRRALIRVATLGLAITLLPAAIDPSVRSAMQPDPAVRFGLPVGNWLRQNVEAGTWVATNCAGSLPYASELPVLDMLGLTDAHIARSPGDASRWTGHARGDGAYVLSRRPGIIIFGGPEGSEEPWPFPGDEEIAASALFRQHYVMKRVPLEGFDFIYYARQPTAGDGLLQP
jgi:hypothetical protein